MTNPETKFKFVPGNTYSMRSVCDHECVWTYLVVRRTAKSVWLSETTYSTRHGREPGPVKRKLISVWHGEEQVQPHGRYSFSPILGAERVFQPKAVACRTCESALGPKNAARPNGYCEWCEPSDQSLQC